MFLLPISIISFVVKYKTIFFNGKEEISKIKIYLTDKNINIELEEYIIGVVAGEMPALFHEEALKAQAIASRSYALSNMKNKEINITSTINDQVYLSNDELKEKWGVDYYKYYNKIKKCVKETTNLVLKRENKILKAFYFSMSNGYTENSINVFNEASIASKESKWDNPEIKNFIVEKKISKKNLKEMLDIKEEEIIINNIIRNETGRVDTVEINKKKYTGINLRKLLSLRSTDFTFIQEKEDYIITTKGYGHGVGMSQYGANGMAKEGYTFDEILTYYYNNVKIENI